MNNPTHITQPWSGKNNTQEEAKINKKILNPRYITLDLMRGIAAFSVLIFHIDYMLGPQSIGMHKGYLAVDFFFILSGFVITANYHKSTNSEVSWFKFISARISRLWPLFIITTIFGAFVVTIKLNRDFGFLDTKPLTTALILNLSLIHI